MFRQPPGPDFQRLQEQQTPQPNEAGRSGQRNQNNALSEVSWFPPAAVQQQAKLRMEDLLKDFYELQEFNVYFTDAEQSFCFIYLLWIAASQCHGTSFSERLKMFKIKSCISFIFYTSNKNIWVCFDTLSDELNMQTSRLPRSLMYYITYGFFESNTNKSKSASNTKKKFNSSLWSKVLSVIRRGPSCLLCFLALCPHCSPWSFSHSGSKVEAGLWKDSEQVLSAEMHFL